MKIRFYLQTHFPLCISMHGYIELLMCLTATIYSKTSCVFCGHHRCYEFMHLFTKQGTFLTGDSEIWGLDSNLKSSTYKLKFLELLFKSVTLHMVFWILFLRTMSFPGFFPAFSLSVEVYRWNWQTSVIIKWSKWSFAPLYIYFSIVNNSALM